MKELDLTIDTLCKNNDEAFNCDSVSTEKLGLFHLIMSKRKDPVVSLMQDNVYMSGLMTLFADTLAFQLINKHI